MKNKVLITVAYFVDADDFFDKNEAENYYEVDQQIDGNIKKYFPEKIELKEGVWADNGTVCIELLGDPKQTIEECPVCNYLMTDTEHSNYPYYFERIKRLKGVNICDRCDYEIAYDVEKLGRSVESVIEEVHSGKTMFDLHGCVFVKKSSCKK